jgi:hypothetical protein
MPVAPAFVDEMNTQISLARGELAAATAACDTDAAETARARLADLTDLLHRTGMDVAPVAV